MAALKLNRLREIVLRVYEDGHRGCLDLKDDYADELIQELMAEMSKEKDSGDWRVYTVEELRKKPLGTIFEHSRLGKCWIDGNEKLKTVTFEDGHTTHIMENSEPWTENMREIGKL